LFTKRTFGWSAIPSPDEQARKKKRVRHGGNLNRVRLDGAAELADDRPSDDFLATNEALERLEQLNVSRAEIVNCGTLRD
jgi:hypothetical protein